MLDSVDNDDAFVIVDLVHDSVVATSGREQALELPDEHIGEPMWVLGDRPVQGRQGRVAHLDGQVTEMPEPFRRDAKLETWRW